MVRLQINHEFDLRMHQMRDAVSQTCMLRLPS